MGALHKAYGVVKCPCCVSGVIFPKKNPSRFIRRCKKRLKKLFNKR